MAITPSPKAKKPAAKAAKPVAAPPPPVKAKAEVPPVKPAPAPTLTLKHLASEISEAHEMSKKQADGLLGDVVDRIVGHLKQGDRIRIAGLGILEVKKRAARMGRNPGTGEPMEIKASKKVAFRPAKELKESI
jgi:DNA-binding protein HU-beta